MPGIMFATSNAAWTIWANKFSELRSSTLLPPLARVLRAYDPDYLVDATCTLGDIEAISPGWHARHIENWPQDPEETATELKLRLDVVVYGDHSEDIGRDLCSPYAGPGQLRPLQELSPEGEHLMPRLATVLGGPLCSDFVIPEGLEPPLTLGRIHSGGAERPDLAQRYVERLLSEIRSDRRLLARTRKDIGCSP